MSRCSSPAFSLAALTSFLLIAACGKSGKDDTSVAPSPPIAQEGAKEGDLEASILAPGPKTVTAMGSDGRTEVMELGKTLLADTDTYLVNAVLPAQVGTGTDSFVTIHLTPKPGWKINQEFPTKLKVTAPEGVSVSPESQGVGEAATFTEKSAQFRINFSATTAGDKDFTASFKFAMCTDTTCDPKSADLAWKLAVK